LEPDGYSSEDKTLLMQGSTTNIRLLSNHGRLARARHGHLAVITSNGTVLVMHAETINNPAKA